MDESHRIQHSVLLWLSLAVNTVGVFLIGTLAARDWQAAAPGPVRQVLGAALHPMVATTTQSIIRASGKAVYAEDRATKRTLWTFTYPKYMKSGWVDPVVADDRVVLIPTYTATFGMPACTTDCAERERQEAEPSYLHAVDALTGALLWKAPLDGPSPARFLDVKNDRVTIGTEKGYWYTIRIFDLTTGALVWRTDIDEESK